MKLTRSTDYSLRVLNFLAAQSGRGATIAQVAATFVQPVAAPRSPKPP
jgi:DNA-binding IscR family transcriptional regulator